MTGTLPTTSVAEGRLYSFVGYQAILFNNLTCSFLPFSRPIYYFLFALSYSLHSTQLSLYVNVI